MQCCLLHAESRPHCNDRRNLLQLVQQKLFIKIVFINRSNLIGLLLRNSGVVRKLIAVEKRVSKFKELFGVHQRSNFFGFALNKRILKKVHENGFEICADH